MKLSPPVIMGYILGAVIFAASARFFVRPIKALAKLSLSCVLSLIFMAVINAIPLLNIHMGINGVSVLTGGILGIPGICLLLTAQIFF